MIDCNQYQGKDFDKLVYHVVMKVRKVGKVDMADNKGYTHDDLINSIRFTLEKIHRDAIVATGDGGKE